MTAPIESEAEWQEFADALAEIFTGSPWVKEFS